MRKVGANRDHRANTYLAFQPANKFFILDDLQGCGPGIAWARGILVSRLYRDMMMRERVVVKKQGGVTGEAG